jgi:hypothetical protein
LGRRWRKKNYKNVVLMEEESKLMDKIVTIYFKMNINKTEERSSEEKCSVNEEMSG